MKLRTPKYLGLTVPFFLAYSVAYAGDDALVTETNFVPAGLEISEGVTGEASVAIGVLGPAAGIAQMIQAAAASASPAAFLDFSFARGADLSWDKWFTPSKDDREW